MQQGKQNSLIEVIKKEIRSILYMCPNITEVEISTLSAKIAQKVNFLVQSYIKWAKKLDIEEGEEMKKTEMGIETERLARDFMDLCETEFSERKCQEIWAPGFKLRMEKKLVPLLKLYAQRYAKEEVERYKEVVRGEIQEFEKRIICKRN